MSPETVRVVAACLEQEIKVKIEDVVSKLSEKYGFDKEDAKKYLNELIDLKESAKSHDIRMADMTNKPELEIQINSTTNEKISAKNKIKGDKFKDDIIIDIINNKKNKKQERDIWEHSNWRSISELENDDVGKAGEEIIQELCEQAGIIADIDGSKTKQTKYSKTAIKGDGTINKRSVEIKTARLSSDKTSFQHELGEQPWSAEYMLFLDISPDRMYLTLFPNFSEQFYKRSGCDKAVKCEPIFPTKSICWRKQKGAFKLDTTIKMNENNKRYTLVINSCEIENFKKFVDTIIPGTD